MIFYPIPNVNQVSLENILMLTQSRKAVGISVRSILDFGVILALAAIIALGGCSQDSGSYTKYIERAKKFEQQGELKSAIIELKNAARLNPSNAEVRWMLGTIYIQLTDGTAAEKELRRGLDLGVDKRSILPYLGEALFQQAKFVQLLKEIQPQYFDNVQSRAKVNVLRGDAFRVLGRYDEAVQSYRNALNEVPALIDALVGLVSTALSQGNIPEAERLLEQFDDASISNPKLWIARASVASAKSQDNLSAAYLQRVIELDPNNVNGRIELARLQLIRGEQEAARKNLNKVQSLFEGHPEALFLQAWIAYKDGDLDHAEELLSRHRGLIQGDRRVLVLSGAVAYSSDKPEQATAFLEKVLVFDPKNPSALRLNTAAQLATGESSEIIAMFKPKIGAIKDPKLLTLIGLAALQAGVPAEGLAHLEKAGEAGPELQLVRDELVRKQKEVERTQQKIQDLEREFETAENGLETGKQLFNLYLIEKRLNKALALAQRLSEMYPGNPLPYNLIGVAYWNGGDLKAAHQNFWRSLIIEPEFRAAGLNLSQVALLMTRGPQEAQAEYEKYLAADPNLLELRAEALFLSGRMQEALTTTRNLIELRPGYAPIHFLLARIYINLKETKKAQEALEKTLQIDPSHTMAKVSLIPLLIDEKQFDNAGELIQALELQDRGNTYIPQLKGLLALKQKRFTDAARFFGEAWERTPDNRYNLVNLARARALAGDLQGSVNALVKWLQRRPEDVTMWRELATGYYQLGRNQDAKMAVTRIAELQPGNASILANLAKFSIQVAPDKALEYAERAIALDSSNPAVMDSAGLVLLEHAQVDRALELLQSAVDKEPANRKYQYHLAYALAKSGQDAQARKLLQEVLSSVEPFAERQQAQALLLKLGG